MAQPDPAACCPDAYWCPATEETECPRHRAPVSCCAHPEAHIPMDIAAWDLAQERREQAWLIRLYRRTRSTAPLVLPWVE